MLSHKIDEFVSRVAETILVTGSATAIPATSAIWFCGFAMFVAGIAVAPPTDGP